MPDFAEPLARLITELKRLPGIGQKSAQRIAFHLLRATPDPHVREWAGALTTPKGAELRQGKPTRDLVLCVA